MRLFLAIPLPAALIDELSAIAVRYQSPNDGLRWSAPESWHITLQFLGNIQPEQRDCVNARLRTLHHPPVPVHLDSLGFFDRTGIFFAGALLSPELLSLQQQVTTATQPCGFIPETRPYHPHITLARSKGKAGAGTLHTLKANLRRQPVFTPFTAHEFVLYESLPTPSGSRYEIRERFPFHR
ncbi:MAG: RNA 2',3'-cyclic phosphodiesterase [Silvibacterium sp.]